MNYNLADSPQTKVLAFGPAGGSGSGGAITVSLSNSRVIATGPGSSAIFAQSSANAVSGPIQIAIDQKSLVQGGQPDPHHPGIVAAIKLIGGTANSIVNAGIIHGDASAQGGIAILSNSLKSNTTLTNTGSIFGDVIFKDGAPGLVDNREGGVIAAPTTLDLSGGLLRNAGTLHVGGIGTIGTTTLNGDLVQTSGGVLHVGLDPVNARSDLLQITGKATLGGTVAVDVVSLKKASSTVLIAAGGIDPGSNVTGSSTLLFDFTPVVSGNSLAIATDAHFRSATAGLGETSRNVASYLQSLWDNGVDGFDASFLNLSRLAGSGDFARALTQVSGLGISGVAAARYEASQSFARSAFSCPVFVDGTTIRRQDSCAWFRGDYVESHRNADSSFPGYGWQAWTVKIGGQAEIAPDWFLGGSLGYEVGQLTGNDRLTRANGEALLGVVALKHQLGNWTFSGALDFGYGWFRSLRTIPIGGFVTATASPDSFNTGLHLRAAYEIPLGRFYIEPAIEGDLNYVMLGGFTEQGAGPLNLRVDASSNVVFAGTPRMRFGGRVDFSKTVVADIYADVGVSFISGNDYATNARFAAAPASAGGFSATLRNATVAGRFNAGTAVYIAERTSLRMEYEGMVSGSETSHGGHLRVSYLF